MQQLPGPGTAVGGSLPHHRTRGVARMSEDSERHLRTPCGLPAALCMPGVGGPPYARHRSRPTAAVRPHRSKATQGWDRRSVTLLVTPAALEQLDEPSLRCPAPIGPMSSRATEAPHASHRTHPLTAAHQSGVVATPSNSPASRRRLLSAVSSSGTDRTRW